MESFEHGGNIHKAIRENGHRNSDMLDFSANINPYGPPEWLRGFLSSQLELLVHYPDPENNLLIKAVSRHTGVPESSVVVGNGTTEILYTFMRVAKEERVLVPVPSYVDYVRSAELAGKKVETFELLEQDDFLPDLNTLAKTILPGDLVVIATPNNPTGSMVDREQLVTLIGNHPHSRFLIDEAFLDFHEDHKTLAGTCENIVTLNSMTKFYGVPGLRIGYGLMEPELAALLRTHIPPWSVNTLAQSFGGKVLGDLEYQSESRKFCSTVRDNFLEQLQKYDQFKVYPGKANYFFIRLNTGSSETLANHFLKKGILIRRCDNYLGLDTPSKYFRIAVRTDKENLKFLEALHDFYSPGMIKTGQKKKTPAIMFQGTCSDAGKSILTAALCRILLQDGFSVAPFKAQNMSLNSFVTLDGDEMGRAQVVQAQAAHLTPDCRMNPVLLKPNSDTGSQIIVSGKPVANMSVLEYNDYKPKVWESVCRAYDSLSAEHDVMVLEGAGSPGEVNLKADDIVNMRMAKYAESPVLLVGDIDRGGVYASFVGIMEVLAEWERSLIAGFIVNKFRGQASLLETAHSYVHLHTGKHVFGVVPHLMNLGLPEEDSVSFKKGSFNVRRNGEHIEIGLINLPHISNFTDVEPFLEEPDVALRVIEKKGDLGAPDAVILPGSKNVINDLEFLQKSGLFDALKEYYQRGGEIVGICGGYQMLGRTISDPFQMESTLGRIEGLRILDIETVIEKDKNLTRKSGIHIPSGMPVSGYEIHHGISSADDSPLLEFEDGSSCGTSVDTATAWGSYLHGIFDSDTFRSWFIDKLRLQKGLQTRGGVLAPYDLESEFDRLAQVVRENVDMDGIYSLLKL